MFIATSTVDLVALVYILNDAQAYLRFDVINVPNYLIL